MTAQAVQIADHAMVTGSSYKQTELGLLPNDWETPQLREGIFLKSGYHVLARYCNSDGDGTPYLTGPADFPNGTIVQTKYVTRPSSLCNKGDILVTVKGSGAGKIVRSDRVYCISRQLMAIQTRCWNADYVEYALRYSPTISAAVTGLIPGLSREDILGTRIAIPSSEIEQAAIAEALHDADALIESIEQLIAKKRAVKQGAMQDLLSGRRRLPGFDSEWESKRLGDIGETLIGLTYSPRDVRESGTLVLRSSNVQGEKVTFENNVHVDMEIPERALVRENDILVCVRNGSKELIGKSAKIDNRCQGMAFGAFMGVFRTPYHDFVFHQFKSDEFKRQVNEHLGATINQITNKSLKSFEIPFPTDGCERTEIAHVLNDMGAELEALDLRLQKARQIKQGKMQELLTGRVRLV